MFSPAKNNKAKTTPDEEAITPAALASSSQTGNDFPRLKQHPKEMATMRQAQATERPLASCFRAQDTVPPKKPMSTKIPSIKAISDFGNSCMSMQQYVNHAEETEVQRRMKCQRQEHMIEKMEWIYKILCALTTMKNKDLKTSVTLSSVYVNAIMRDAEEAKVLLNHSQSLISSTLDDGHNICTDMWETFVSSQEPELKDTKKAGYKPGQFGLRRRARMKELENDAGELPPWLNLLWNEKVSYEKNPQTHREKTVKARRNTLMASRKDTILPALLSSLKSEVEETKSSSMLWFQMLQKEAPDSADGRAEEFSSVMRKICQFDSFSHDKLPFCKEKFCLLVLSLPADQLLRPAMQDALMFLAKNVLQLPPHKLKCWFLHLKLPFYDDSSD